MRSLNLLPVFKNLIHKIVWNEMELNSYRGSCHRFIPCCLTVVNGLHEIFPVNKLSNRIRLSATHCLVVINLLQPCRAVGWRDVRPWGCKLRGCCGLSLCVSTSQTKNLVVWTAGCNKLCKRKGCLKHHLSFFFLDVTPSEVKAYFI